MPNCLSCVYLREFSKRPDEPSDRGCRQKDWAGYVINPARPPCAGVGYCFMKSMIDKVYVRVYHTCAVIRATYVDDTDEAKILGPLTYETPHVCISEAKFVIVAKSMDMVMSEHVTIYRFYHDSPGPIERERAAYYTLTHDGYTWSSMGKKPASDDCHTYSRI